MVRKMVIALLDNILICAKSRIFADFLARVRARIIVDILFMFLTTSPQEENNALNDPKEFMTLACDI